jgi:hypothetical protein
LSKKKAGQKSATEKKYADQERALRKIKGLEVPSGPLTDAKKRKLTKLGKEWGAIAANPKDFKIISTKTLGPQSVAALKKTGYKELAGRLYIPLQGYEGAEIKREFKKTKDGYKRVLTVERFRNDPGTTTERKRAREIIGTPAEKLEWRDKLRAEYEELKFTDNDNIMVKVFDNSPMIKSEAWTLEKIFAYVERIRWDTSQMSAGDLRDNLHLVRVTVKDHNEASILKSTSQLRSEQRRRTKNRQKLGFFRVTKPKTSSPKKKTQGRGPK